MTFTTIETLTDEQIDHQATDAEGVFAAICARARGKGVALFQLDAEGRTFADALSQSDAREMVLAAVNCDEEFGPNRSIEIVEVTMVRRGRLADQLRAFCRARGTRTAMRALDMSPASLCDALIARMTPAGEQQLVAFLASAQPFAPRRGPIPET